MSGLNPALQFEDLTDLCEPKVSEVCVMFTVTVRVGMFYTVSPSNVTMPCPSSALRREHLSASSHSGASIPGFMPAVAHNAAQRLEPISNCLGVTDPSGGEGS